MKRRDLIKSGVAGLGCFFVPDPGWADTDDWLARVDPELRPMGRIILNAEQKGITFALPANMPLPDGVVERSIPGPSGAPPVTIYIANSSGPLPSPRGAILHIHGGGFISGSARLGLRALQNMAERLNCVAVSVDYRLAPATRFPGSLEDNYAALLWLHNHAEELGADRARIALFGESAGGGHVAMLAIAARDRGVVRPVLQAMLYPMLDDRTGTPGGAPIPPGAGHIVWTPQRNVEGWSALLGQRPGLADVPAGAVPARTSDLQGLPPAFIAVGTLDLFVEEDITYAGRLIESGVPAELLVVPGAYHGFDILAPSAAVSRSVHAVLETAIAQALGAR